MARLYFLGTDRLSHCDQEWPDILNNPLQPAPCNEMEYYYTGEVLKFAMQVNLKSLGQQVIGSGFCSTNWDGFPYFWDPSSASYVDGLHYPIVYGTPKIKFSFLKPGGENALGVCFPRYAELSREFSIPMQGYYEYHYTIQGVDSNNLFLGNPQIPNYTHRCPDDFIVSDPENRISYSQVCSSGEFPPQATSFDLTQSTFNSLLGGGTQVVGYNVPNTYNVLVNHDSDNTATNSARILLKRSSVADKVPLASDLLYGELALNTNDGKAYMKKADDSVVMLGSIEPQDFNTLKIDVSSNATNMNLGTRALARLNVTAAGLEINGFAVGKDGEIKMLYNAGSYGVKILNSSVVVHNGQDFDLLPNSGVTIVYDGTSEVWRLF